jgi:hypothetical protein
MSYLPDFFVFSSAAGTVWDVEDAGFEACSEDTASGEAASEAVKGTAENRMMAAKVASRAQQESEGAMKIFSHTGQNLDLGGTASWTK